MDLAEKSFLCVTPIIESCQKGDDIMKGLDRPAEAHLPTPVKVQTPIRNFWDGDDSLAGKLEDF